MLGSTLILTWTPNLTLAYNTRSLENSPLNLGRAQLVKRSPRLEYAQRGATVCQPTGRANNAVPPPDVDTRRLNSTVSNASVEMHGEHLTAVIDEDECTSTTSQCPTQDLLSDVSTYHTNFSQLLIDGYHWNQS